MRRMIDAHLHIVPGHLLGKTAKRYSVTVEAYGVKRFAGGSIHQFMPDMEFLHEFLMAHGADKPIWGSDIPVTLCYGTYRQLADAFEKCTLFTEEQKSRMFCQNAQEAHF